MIFDKAFFEKRQRVFLFLLNVPLVGQILRRALWIDDLWHPLTKITPTAYHVWTGWKKYRATLYSNPQYAEALHRSFGWVWKLAHLWDALIANPLRPEWNLGFDTYTSQPDGTAGIDTIIIADFPTTNYATDFLEVGDSNSIVDTCRELIKFDYSSLQSTYTVSSAVLSQWESSEQASNARDLNIYRQKRDWVENQATWNIWKTSNNWSTAGGFHADDCEQTAIATRNFSATEAAGEKQWSFSDLTAIAAMFTGGAWTNNGFLIKADTEVDDAHLFRSSDYATAGERPKMVIVYTTGTVYEQAVGGGITPSGVLVRKTNKPLVGAITPTGVLVKLTSKIVSGAITPTGALVRKTLKTLSGALTPAGTLTKNISKILSGALTFIGQLLGFEAGIQIHPRRRDRTLLAVARDYVVSTQRRDRTLIIPDREEN